MSPTRIIPSSQVDSIKWNQLVESSPNGLIYSTTTYLNTMTTEWYACIYGDYEAVMPLPTKSKWGFRYAYQPAFVQQLGVISLNESIDEYLEEFLPLIKKHFSYIDIKLNYQHSGELRLNNYTLDLNTPLEKLQMNFSRSFKEAFKQSKKHGGRLYFSNDLTQALAFNASLYDFRSVSIKQEEYQRFGKLCEALKAVGQCIIPTWMDGDQVIAQAIVLKDSKRYYLMTSACLEEGRAKRANHALMYYFLEHLCGESMTFDFEGSNIPGVAKFYESMGGVLETYPPMQANYLPKLLAWLKR